MDTHKYTFLYIAIFIPMLMILVIGLMVFDSQKHLSIHHNFIYGMVHKQNANYCATLLKLPFTSDTPIPAPESVDCGNPNLYIYNFAYQISMKINIDEAKKILLTASPDQPKSPDGFMILPSCHARSILTLRADHDGDNNVCLSKNHYQKRLNIAYPSNDSFVFIGWTVSNPVS